MIKVLLADDHAVVRQGMKQILRDVPELIVAGEASDGDQTLERLRAEDWDLVVMDISMPGRNGLDILKLIQYERPKLPVLIMSMHSEDQFAVRMLKAGAAGYLTKESAPEELVTAIRKIISGGRYVSPTLAEQLAFHMHPEAERAAHEILSDREFQVMRLIAKGQTVKEIGEALTLSVKTISTYRARVLEKLKLRTNADLIHYAIQNGLIE